MEPLRLTVQALRAAWLPTRRRLVTRSPHLPRVGDRVVVLISGAEAEIPLSGTVRAAAAWRGEARVEIEIDPERLPALRRLADFLDGVAEAPKPRAPRVSLELPVAIHTSSASTYMTTVSLSPEGCGLNWEGRLPSRGHLVTLSLWGGPRAPTFLARVCWVRALAGGPKVGLRFLGGPRQALVPLLSGLTGKATPR